MHRIGILSDIHYASAAEQARGNDYELCGIRNPALRAAMRIFRHFIWLRHPLYQGYLLDRFLDRVGECDYVVALGDFSCSSGFVGLSDDPSFQSARECVGKLRARFGDRFLAAYGDHELGKLSMFGRQGGMRLASWHRTRDELGLPPFWRLTLGRYVLLGLVSSLVELPMYEPDMLSTERAEWQRLRREHLDQVRQAFAALQPDERVLLFCHDPSALPFLGREEVIRSKLPQVEQTIVGHLHSNLVFWKSRLLAGMPRIGFLGHTGLRLTTALSEARNWRPFRVRLCPALAGIEMLKDGGFYTVDLDPEARQPARWEFHHVPRSSAIAEAGVKPSG